MVETSIYGHLKMRGQQFLYCYHSSGEYFFIFRCLYCAYGELHALFSEGVYTPLGRLNWNPSIYSATGLRLRATV